MSKRVLFKKIEEDKGTQLEKSPSRKNVLQKLDDVDENERVNKGCPIKTGERFGQCVAIRLELPPNAYNEIKKWLCKCDCGNEFYAFSYSLKRGITTHCGCHPINNIVGQKFGRLTAIKRLNRQRHGSYYWLFKCDCGKDYESIAGDVNKKDGTKSCGCLRQEMYDNKVNPESLFNNVYLRYKWQAEDRSITFDLTKEQCVNLMKQNCHYCGIPPSNHLKNAKIPIDYSGIDRVDNAKGYSVENTVTCCYQCNRTKRERSVTEFKSHIYKIYDNLVKNNIINPNQPVDLKPNEDSSES